MLRILSESLIGFGWAPQCVVAVRLDEGLFGLDTQLQQHITAKIRLIILNQISSKALSGFLDVFHLWGNHLVVVASQFTLGRTKHYLSDMRHIVKVQGSLESRSTMLKLVTQSAWHWARDSLRHARPPFCPASSSSAPFR